MRIQESRRGYFRGTHKGALIEIEREREPLGDGVFYIRVRGDNGEGSLLYDGWAPAKITTMPQAKREAIRGACLELKST
jgi:hypothetical protein